MCDLNEINSMLDSLKRQNELAERKLLRRDEVRQLLDGFDKKVLSLLNIDSIPYRIYEAGTKGKTMWWKESHSSMANSDDHNKIKFRIELLEQVLQELEPDFLQENDKQKNEFYFHKGETYKSKKKLNSLMKQASKSLVIVDLYLDDSVLPFIDSLPQTLKIKLISGKIKSIFKTLYEELSKINPNIEAKYISDCHDRFLIIDNNDIWHLGTSINGFGKSAFMIKQINDIEEKRKFLMDFQTWWENGKSLKNTA